MTEGFVLGVAFGAILVSVLNILGEFLNEQQMARLAKTDVVQVWVPKNKAEKIKFDAHL